MTQDPPSNPQLLTEAELAEQLRVSPATIADWRRPRNKGRGPEPVRIGHRIIRYRQSDVDAWLAARAAEQENG